MKKILIGLIAGLLISSPLAVGAWNDRQMAKPIYGVDCKSTQWYKDRGYTKDAEYYEKNPNDLDCSTAVYVFDDDGNKCYVVKGSNASGISCLRY